MEATSTVFVTVYPTSPVVTEGGSPDGSGSAQTVYGTVHPTRTIQVSPINSAQATDVAPSPFTTITIDVSGSDSGSHGDTDSTTGSPSGSPDQGGSSPSGAQPNGSPASYGNGNGAPWPNTATTTAGPTGPDGSAGPLTATANAPHATSPWYTVVTDSSVQWVTGSDGPKPITILSEHTLTIGVGSTNAPGNGEPLTCITTTGPDGRPTIIEWPAGNPQEVNGGQPASTAAAVTTDINGNPVPEAASTVINPSTPVVTGMNSQGTATAGGSDMSTACTTYTVLGTDGIPTIVHSSWLVPQNVPATGAPGALPTDAPAPAQTANLPKGVAGVTTCTSYTILGADGKPTVVESTLVLPGAQSTQEGAPGTPPNGIPIQTTVPGSPGPVVSGGLGSQAGVTTCTTYTVLGVDGRPTIVDTTYVVPGPVATPVPSNIAGGLITGAPTPTDGSSGFPQPGNGRPQGITTCITYTAIGPDGRPTIVESTVVMPASDAVSTASDLAFPSAITQHQSGLPQGISVTGNLITTAVTVDILGTDGLATPVVETIVLTPPIGAGSALPTSTSLGFPSAAPEQMPSNLPQGVPPFTPGSAVTTCVTVDVVGTNGVATPVVQTIVLTPGAPGSGNPTAPPIANTAGLSLPPSGLVPGLSTVASGVPPLDAYGPAQPNQQTVFPPSAAVSGVDTLPTGTVPGAGTTVYTVVTGPNGIPVLSPVTGLPLPSYGNSQQAGAVPGNNGAPTAAGQAPNGYGWGASQAGAAYGPISLGAVATALQTATWTNIIPEQTTTYTIDFPFTTLVTVAVPDKRALKRQVNTSPSALSTGWANSTTSLDINTSLGAIPSVSAAPDSGSSPMCPSGGKIGNTTVNFDTVKPGPLFNPSGDIWFSEGFLVAPPSTPASQSFAPASGGQLVEFVPASLSGSPAHGADVAEIGVGPNSANPCFRFDFLSASLGCAADGNEKWCEFGVSAYTFDEGSLTEQSIAWSETKRVPACPDFPSNSCELTPVEFEGYTNITAVLISLHVGLELRAWWGDDFKFGWSDNSCEAASCRGRALPHRVKRETVESAITHGVWHWTPAGLQRLDNEYIWESAS
ncbi:hypothetical protein O9K51_04948 [Purpureocillium lavendulum]|uniref:DUF7371 domain-containing protein n=1 Tax=Purpureocillium lavendulum TaxID=1247861 RepID=A0AB34FQK5_9HYPO|nr:hypothetical protein O9K51_04948 [Purpureocillium lavendulum]